MSKEKKLQTNRRGGDLGRAEPGWSPLRNRRSVGGARPYIRAIQTADIVKIKWFVRDEDRALVGKCVFGAGAEGPPGHAHGGSIAALFDELMGASAWAAGYPVLAARVIADFHRPIPLGETVQWSAWVRNVKERKVWTQARLEGPDGTLFAEGRGLFIIVTSKHFGKHEAEARVILKKSGIDPDGKGFFEKDRD